MKISPGGSLKKVGSMVFVCLCVHSSILAPGARTAKPIGTGDGLFDAPDLRKDDGVYCGVNGATCHVVRVNVKTIAKNLLTGLQV